MTEAWSQVPLGEFAQVVGGGTPSTKEPAYWGGDVAWITPKDLARLEGRFVAGGDRSITAEGLEASAAKVLPPNTLVVSSRAPIGYVAIAAKPLATNQGCRSLVFEDDEPRFFYYVLKSSTKKLEALANGTTFKEISGTGMKRVVVPRPPLDQQKAIASTLGAFDNKIEQRQQTAQTLEQLARAIFRSWFVDFEPAVVKAAGAASYPSMPRHIFESLPGRFVDSDVGPIPDGWRVKALDDVATFLNGLALQKYPPRGDGSDLPVIKIAQLRRGSTEGADAANDSIDEKYKVKDGDLLFSWSGTLEAVRWFGGPGALNQHLFTVASAEYPQWLIYEWLHQHLPEFRLIAASKATTMGHIKREHLRRALVAVPPKELVGRCGEVLSPLFEASATARLESRELAEARDYLLPKLLSGEARVQVARG